QKFPFHQASPAIISKCVEVFDQIEETTINDPEIEPFAYQKPILADYGGVVWFKGEMGKFAMDEVYFDLIFTYWPRIREEYTMSLTILENKNVFYMRNKSGNKSTTSFNGGLVMACGAMNIFWERGWPELEVE
ncbi:MAG: hypothetical protein ACP5RW_10050, partial [bacterium]